MREALRRRRARTATGDAGITLVETLVSMAVFSIAISLVYSAVILVAGKTRDVEGSAEAASQVRQALAQIDRQVRSGNVLYSPANEPAYVPSCTAATASSGSCMRVYTQANGLDRCVQWQVLADVTAPGTSVLRSRNWAPDWVTTGTVSGWEVVARGLVGSTSAPAFALDGGGAYGARLLNVRFEAIDERRGGAPTLITSSLSGRNTNYGYDGGQCTPVPAA